VARQIEVAYALPERQRVITLDFVAGLTAGEAVRASGICREFPELAARPLVLGVYGEVVADAHSLRPGDRVEIYRELAVDPRDARRLRAAQAAPPRGRGRCGPP
jgi:putative ubiquitin-RnfH superfamily antitoxin RatB of RatAB toxin-antitoxin module